MSCNDRKCGSCTYNRFDGEDYSCNNEESENYGAYTDHDTVCDEWVQKGGAE